jgi:hypothetical protein
MKLKNPLCEGARQDGGVGFRKKLPRGQLLAFLTTATVHRRHGGLCDGSLLGPREMPAPTASRCARVMLVNVT